ncbi:MAG: cell envelope biogenesis protein OmpA, partial [Alphaproteobacteria bacterium]|nr:cell envelope biogenesis protein OmpA [Alphaproteobacteria bacterium]
MRFKTLFLASSAAAALALSAGAASAEPDGWYGAVDAGYHFTENNINLEATGNGVNWQAEMNDGWA